MFVVGVLLLIFAGIIRYFVRKKDFERTNSAGVREHRSYNSYLKNSFVEKLLMGISGVMILFGIFFIIASIFGRH